MKRIFLFLTLSLVPLQQSFAQVSQNFLSESQPRYELGAGAIGMNIPDYPGSSNNRIRVIPFPYYIYRGEFLRTDDEGTRARMFSSKYHETGVSFSFNFPVRSSNNEARLGMPDLDSLLGIGPRFLFRLLQKNVHHRLNLSLSARALFSTDFSSRLQSEGLSMTTSLNYWYRKPSWGTTFFSRTGIDFGTVEFNRFFYQVTPENSTVDRQTYDAEAGLVQTYVSLGMGQDVTEDIAAFCSVSWRNLDLSINRESPLVETPNNLAVVLGVVWTFYESEEKIRRP